jgi:hypothetical protein
VIKQKLKFCNGCGHEKPIFKNKMVNGERFQLCLSCSKKEHVPLKSTPKQIKKRSDKKKIEDRLYTILRKKYQSQNPDCELRLPGCTTTGTEIHHTAYRTGENYLDTTTWKNSCRNCHSFVHSHPQEARELGFLK